MSPAAQRLDVQLPPAVNHRGTTGGRRRDSEPARYRAPPAEAFENYKPRADSCKVLLGLTLPT